MMENFDKEYWKQKPCPKYDCKKNACKCGLKKVFLAAALGDDSANSPVAPKNGAYCNAIVAYEANGNVYIYSTDGVPTLVEFGTSNIRKLADTLGKEIENRISGDQILQDEIDAIKNSPDVVDIVATYADLIAYDTTNLGDNDIIRVLQDEEHDGASTYYRWDKPDDTWLYIGEVGDYYTKGQVNTLLNAKQDKLIAGTNITISGNVISSTGTAYVAGDGIIINNGTISINPAVVQEKFAGVLTEEDYNQDDIIDPSTLDSGYYILRPEVTLQINDEYTFSYDTDMLFYLNNGSTGDNISYDLIIFDLDLIQYSAYESDGDMIVEVRQYVAQSQIDSMIVRSDISPTTSTVGALGQLYEDESTGNVYICTAIDDSDPNDIIYTWAQIGAGGGGPTVVQTTGTSQTDVMSQNATTSMIFGDAGTNNKIVIGTGASVSAQSYNMAIGTNSSANGTQSTAVGYTAKARSNGTALGYGAQAGTSSSQSNATAIGQSAYGGGDHCTAVGDSTNTLNSYSTAVGASARARSERSVAIGASANVDNSPAMDYSVALGANSVTTRAGEVNVGTGSSNVGYNSTPYRVIGGVHDGQLAQDAATVKQVNNTIDAINTALGTNIPHIGV